MRAAFYASEKPREQFLARAFADGCAAHGDSCDILPASPKSVRSGYDAAAMVGVKSREIWRASMAAGAVPIMLDKGYTRHKVEMPIRCWEYWRVAIGAHHPSAYLMGMDCPPDRFRALGIDVRRWTRKGRHIVIAGSSAKYHAFYGLDGPTEYAARIIARLHKLTDRLIIYRPKPSWRDARPLSGARFSHGTHESIDQVLDGAHCLITHGSNACFEAAILGVPSIVLGDGVGSPISSRDMRDIENPLRCAEKTRLQWLANLAYCQWTLAEFSSGAAWRHIHHVAGSSA